MHQLCVIGSVQWRVLSSRKHVKAFPTPTPVQPTHTNSYPNSLAVDHSSAMFCLQFSIQRVFTIFPGQICQNTSDTQGMPQSGHNPLWNHQKKLR